MDKSSKRTAIFVTASLALIFFAGSAELRRRHDDPTFPTVVQASDLEEDRCSGMMAQASSSQDAPASVGVAGGDIVPVRSVEDPYPSLHSVAVDPANNRVVISDSNRGSILFYERTAGSSSSQVVVPKWNIRGPATGMMFVAGVALDTANREVFAVNNDIGDRMEVFPYGVEGNVKPKRVLFVPHGSWGVSLNKPRDEIAISVEHINSVVVYRREASRAEAPLRVIHGLNTGLADPHGIAFDAAANEILIANHGNWAPLTRAEASEGAVQGGRFNLPSITTYPIEASGDAKPKRTIQGTQTELNWPMGLGLDPIHDEIAVASYGNNSILVFHRTDNGNAVPVRMIRGNRTGVLGPVGVAFDPQNNELWVTNYRDHIAVVFPRTAEGNIAPKRILRNAPLGTPAVGFGNPGAVAYDSKREEILVPN
jgi:DNA-binding beta-propeller fold protein YncE